MRIPELEGPENYGGLYVFDFGDEQTAVGYTAEEIAVLLDSDRYKDGKVYRIHRALPDGTLELQGVARERFATEEGLFFYRTDPDAAHADLKALESFAQATPPPCRMKVQLARLKDGLTQVVAMIHPAEYSADVSSWLNSADFQGGDRVEGGVSAVTDYYAAQPEVLERRQWWPAKSISRAPEEVLATTHLAVQRRMVG